MPFKYTNASSKWGADMGRQDVLPDGPTRLHLERVPMVDGDYDPGGAYWGGYPSNPLYVAWNEDGAQIFVRASDRERAKVEILDIVSDDVEFYRIPGEQKVQTVATPKST